MGVEVGRGLGRSLHVGHRPDRQEEEGGRETALRPPYPLPHLARDRRQEHRDDADPQTVARQAVVLLLGYFALEGSLMQNGPAEARRAAWLNEVSSLLARSLSW